MARFRSPFRKKTGFYTRSPVNIHGVRSPLAFKGPVRSPIRRRHIFHGGGMGGGFFGGGLFGPGQRKKKKEKKLKMPKRKAYGLRFYGPGNQRRGTKAPTLAGGYRKLWKG